MMFIAIAAISWGTIGIAVSVLYRVARTDALSISFLRLAIAAPVLVLMSRVLAGPFFVRVTRRDLAGMVLMGIAFAGYQVCYFGAIPRIGVALAVLLNICSAPIFIALLAHCFLGERLTMVMIGALVGAVGGTTLLVAAPNQGAAPASLLGASLAVGAGASYAVVAVCARAVADRYHPVQPLAVAFTLGAVLLFPLALRQGLVIQYPPLGWLLLLHLGLVPTTLGYAVYMWGVRTTPATVAAILTLLEPLVSTLLAVVLLDERLAPTSVLGGLILLGSVLLLYVQNGRFNTAAVES
jgi:DME family drug/metabolite transporter